MNSAVQKELGIRDQGRYAADEARVFMGPILSWREDFFQSYKEGKLQDEEPLNRGCREIWGFSGIPGWRAADAAEIIWGLYTGLKKIFPHD